MSNVYTVASSGQKLHFLPKSSSMSAGILVASPFFGNIALKNVSRLTHNYMDDATILTGPLLLLPNSTQGTPLVTFL